MEEGRVWAMTDTFGKGISTEERGGSGETRLARWQLARGGEEDAIPGRAVWNREPRAGGRGDGEETRRENSEWGGGEVG